MTSTEERAALYSLGRIIMNLRSQPPYPPLAFHTKLMRFSSPSPPFISFKVGAAFMCENEVPSQHYGPRLGFLYAKDFGQRYHNEE
ncbi:hypothetical protein NC651_014181 [Populus alba x Populus x berolinensis]|nr:hypothetical protein NC651_014181 [Populus alba x Populus x berolinensis]